MQSTLYRPNITVSHLAVALDATGMTRLPDLVDACSDLGVETLTVCTLPPDLRLADFRETTTMLDALASALHELDFVDLRLVGRRFYLPERISRLFAAATPGDADIKLRIAIDYACRASFLNPDSENGPATVALLPAGCNPGNLLRWHYAHARFRYVNWQRFDASNLSALLDVTPRQPKEVTVLRSGRTV